MFINYQNKNYGQFNYVSFILIIYLEEIVHLKIVFKSLIVENYSK